MGQHTVELTDANFEELVLKSEKPVFVDFWAQWCGPCLAIAPALEELADEYKGTVVIGKLDVDANPAISQHFRITSIPTLMLFKGGEMIDKQVGAAPKPVLKKKIEGALVS
ncbi:MAG: thioredoxin [Bacteroidetes bacterium]|jgi:thioredoxin 1|nr:thioredoxin [Bacteroidota bacterium]